MNAARPKPATFDIALAAVFGVVLQAELWLNETYEDTLVFSGSKPANAAFLLVMAAAFAWRRAAPMVSFCTVMGAVTAQSLLLGGSEAGGIFILILASVYSVAVHDSRWQISLAVVAVTLLVHDLMDPQLTEVGDHLYAPIFAVVGFALGRTVRHRQAQAASSELRAEAATAEARDAVVRERARIAREIHDIVSHSVSVMVVQAGAAEQVIDSDPEMAKRALGAVQTTGRGAVDDLSRLLGLLREGDEAEELEPQPALRDLDPLLARFREAGVAVSFDSSGAAPEDLPQGIQLAIYRFAQEGLTNVLRHAGSTDATLRVVYAPREVELELTNARGLGGGGAGTGSGLVGLRERFAVYGGAVETRELPDGGFALSGNLPLHEAPRTTAAATTGAAL